MAIPKLTVPFRYFQGRQMPESSERLSNFPILSKDYPEQKQTTWTKPWPTSATYGRVRRVVDHLADLRSRKKPFGPLPDYDEPASAAPEMEQPEFAAPDAGYDEPEQPQPPVSARRYRRRW